MEKAEEIFSLLRSDALSGVRLDGYMYILSEHLLRQDNPEQYFSQHRLEAAWAELK